MPRTVGSETSEFSFQIIYVKEGSFLHVYFCGTLKLYEIHGMHVHKLPARGFLESRSWWTKWQPSFEVETELCALHPRVWASR